MFELAKPRDRKEVHHKLRSMGTHTLKANDVLSHGGGFDEVLLLLLLRNETLIGGDAHVLHLI